MVALATPMSSVGPKLPFRVIMQPWSLHLGMRMQQTSQNASHQILGLQSTPFACATVALRSLKLLEASWCGWWRAFDRLCWLHCC
ncbi:unnamed protein product [Taenia asiatica]|uniref:Uncharacterized protein n=1 Tax=Taenia asiatica TaxID=60517 RepID=A0A3P6QIJ9_TAEAS|nr:unnamed protein product [Taenia asiatica]